MRDLRQAVHGRAIIMEKRVYKHQILKKLIKKKKTTWSGCSFNFTCKLLSGVLRKMPSIREYALGHWKLSVCMRGGEGERLVSRRGESQVISKKRVHAEEVNGWSAPTRVLVIGPVIVLIFFFNYIIDVI